MKPTNSLVLAGAIVASFAFFNPSTAHAAFTLLENFDGLNPGALNGQNGWTANANTTVAPDGLPDQVASIATGATGNLANYKALGPLTIPNANTSTTVYFNFSLSSGTGNNFNFILTDVAAPPDTAGSSEVQLNSDNSGPSGGPASMRVNNGGSFQHLVSTAGNNSTAVPLVAGSLYRVWFVVNNSTDSYQIWMQNAAIAAIADNPTQLFSTGTGSPGDFKFRNSAGATIVNNDLTTFSFGSSGGTSVVRVDDIYVDLAGVNLVNPVPEPSSAALLGLGALALLRRRR